MPAKAGLRLSQYLFCVWDCLHYVTVNAR